MGSSDSNWLIASAQSLWEKCENLQSRHNLSYQLFEGKDIVGQDAHRSLFKGSIFRNITIKDTDFSRADFEGARFENVTLENVSFHTSGIRSCFFVNSRIINCTMNDAYMHENIFIDTEFENVSFCSSSISRCKFDKCLIRGCDFRKSTSTFNTYQSCSFECTGYLNCTIALCVLSNCTYDSFEIKAESISSLYGFTWRNVQDSDVYYRYELIDTSNQDLFVKTMVEELLGSKWLFSALLTKLNYDSKSLMARLNDFSGGITLLANHGVFINSDEIQFCQMLIKWLADVQMLPLFSLHKMLIGLESIDYEVDSVSEKILIENIRSMHANFYLLYQSMVNKLWNSVGQLQIKKDFHVDLVIIFNKKYELSPDILMNALVHKSTENIAGPTYILYEQGGSWEVALKTTIKTVFALNIFLFSINGSLILATESRARWEALTGERVPVEYKELASTPKQVVPKYFDLMIGNVLKYVGDSEQFSDADKQGQHLDICQPLNKHLAKLYFITVDKYPVVGKKSNSS